MSQLFNLEASSQSNGTIKKQHENPPKRKGGEKTNIMKIGLMQPMLIKIWNRIVGMIFLRFKNTQREEAPPHKTPVLRKSRNMGIWVVGTSNQLFIRGS